jgi:non-homologous end joining protein Ku
LKEKIKIKIDGKERLQQDQPTQQTVKELTEELAKSEKQTNKNNHSVKGGEQTGRPFFPKKKK